MATVAFLPSTAREVQAIPPPTGSVMLLLPLIQQRLLVAECSAAVGNNSTAVSWASLHSLFLSPPLTDPQSRVGGLFLSAAAQYEGSLVYAKTLSVDDKKLCFPRRDDECVRLQIDSDKLYHELLINDALSGLQAVEAELDYLSGCEPGGTPKPGVQCPSNPELLPAGDDRAEILSKLDAAGAAMDKYFDVVPAADARAAVELVARSSPRWDLTLLER